MLIENGLIKEIGKTVKDPTESTSIIDVNQAMITPGFVDPHTHIFPPKDRSNEFSMRVNKTYQEIAAAGGGILSSVRACREATIDEIYDRNNESIQRFIRNGTTTVEIKSGYGLDTENEIKLLKVIQKLKEDYKDYIDIVPTFLGAHAFPPEYKDKRDQYVELICKEMIPEVAKLQIAEYCDVFCENGYFSAEQAEKLLLVAKDHGMQLRLHADEFEDSRAAELAGSLRAHSADHLMAISDIGIKALAENGVVATMLPGTTIFLGKNSFAPARKLINAGCRVALASDHNPGSSVFNSQPMMMNFAMTYGKMILEEAFQGITRNSAIALGRYNLGIIDEGAEADLLVWNGIDNLSQIPYYHYEYQKLVEDLTRRVKFDSQNRIANIPERPPQEPSYDHAPKRQHTLDDKQKELAIKNHLKYFTKDLHPQLSEIFKKELDEFGHIYMFNYMPETPLEAIPFDHIPGKTMESRAMIHMILNNLDPKVAQFPQELITYGSNGAVFSNWGQFQITLKYLQQMNENQCLHMNSGHPTGLWPKLSKSSPSAVISNGMMIPIFSDIENFNNLYALGVTMYGQMTAGSWMYIGPQGIIHGTAITVAQASKLQNHTNPSLGGKLFVTSGLGGMSGAQPKATTIGGGICLVAEINAKALNKRHEQGYLDEKFTDLDLLIKRVKQAKQNKEAVSIGYIGNVVDLWEKLADATDLDVELGSDQTSLHNPFNGGYYPQGLSVEESNKLMISNPQLFKEKIQESLRRQIKAINKLVKRSNMYFFDYGNAFLYEAAKANADVQLPDGTQRYKSYIEDILGPEYFDCGFGPYRWVCTSGDPEELYFTDQIAYKVLEEQLAESEPEIHQQIISNMHWIRDAKQNKMTVGSQARILYSDTDGRIECAVRMNRAIREGKIKAPIVIGRDHHDVSGTDAPLRETSNIYDGSSITADMAIQNVIGDAMRGATWVSIHNGGGTGWGKATNGGFGMVLDGSDEAEQRARQMLFWDVSNGLTRRARAGNANAIRTITKLQKKYRFNENEGYFPFIPQL